MSADINISLKTKVINILNASGLAIVIALIPNAVLGTILSNLWGDIPAVKSFLQVLVYMQSTAAFLIGVNVALTLNLKPMMALMVGVATFYASGVVQFTSLDVIVNGSTVTQNHLTVKGVGDLVNAIFVASVSSVILSKIGNKFGNLTIILLPIIGGAILGAVGKLFLPVTAAITSSIASTIQYFTTLSPLVMSFLLGASFAVIIVSPISSVVVAIAISATGIISGAANLGCTAAMILFGVSSIKVNKFGVTLAAFLGTVKMFVGNIFKHPIIILPLALVGGITGTSAYFLDIQGTTASAGFGFSGLIGPLAAFDYFNTAAVSNPIVRLIISYLIVPIVASVLVNFIMIKIIRIFGYEIYHFDPTKTN